VVDIPISENISAVSGLCSAALRMRDVNESDIFQRGLRTYGKAKVKELEETLDAPMHVSDNAEQA
jgi:hypothetical protein